MTYCGYTKLDMSCLWYFNYLPSNISSLAHGRCNHNSKMCNFQIHFNYRHLAYLSSNSAQISVTLHQWQVNIGSGNVINGLLPDQIHLLPNKWWFQSGLKVGCLALQYPGTCPTNSISIKFKSQSTFAVLCFKVCLTNHKEIFDTSWQYYYNVMCKI